LARVRWSQPALEDLRAIHDFIARDSPSAAGTVMQRLLDDTERLALFPASGRKLQIGYREIIVGRHRVIYRVDGETVWIVAVVHGSRSVQPPHAGDFESQS